MNQFEISKECILNKTVSALKAALLRGEYIIALDIEPIPLLQNVYHYSSIRKGLEIYTLSENKNSQQYNLHFDMSIMTDRLSEEIIQMILKETLKNYEQFIVDKYNNLNTSMIYGRN